jgi:hypothetical protein
VISPRPARTLRSSSIREAVPCIGMQGVRGSNPLSSTPGQWLSSAPTAPESPAPGSRLAATRKLSGMTLVAGGLRSRPRSPRGAEGGQVPSAAYQAWFAQRQGRVDQLLLAHQSMGGSGRGRRWRTEQVNWALTFRLAGEFQGYARELHDLAVDHFVSVVARTNLPLANVIRTRMTFERKLDKGNAHPGSLGDDYGRLGLTLWPALEAADPRAAAWNRDLTALNEARNAIAHAEEGRLVVLRADGYPIALRTIRRWKKSLDGLVKTMDDVVSEYLDRLLGAGRPW